MDPMDEGESDADLVMGFSQGEKTGPSGFFCGAPGVSSSSAPAPDVASSFASSSAASVSTSSLHSRVGSFDHRGGFSRSSRVDRDAADAAESAEEEAPISRVGERNKAAGLKPLTRQWSDYRMYSVDGIVARDEEETSARRPSEFDNVTSEVGSLLKSGIGISGGGKFSLEELVHSNDLDFGVPGAYCPDPKIGPAPKRVSRKEERRENFLAPLKKSRERTPRW